MSFSLKDSKKMLLFKKSIQIVCRDEEEFYLRITSDGLRLFNTFRDSSTHIIDFSP